MKRKQFTFYRSFLDAIQALPKKDQLPFVLALIVYALDGDELPLSGPAASAFCIVKPILDNARRKAESGKEGGSKPKQNESKIKQNESKPKQTQANRSLLVQPDKQVKGQEKGQVKVQDKDEDEDPPTPLAGGDVVSVVEEAVGELSARQKDVLWDFADSMGKACILRALDAAQDAGRLNFGYIRGALENKQAQGVKSAEDWDKAEAKFQAAKGGGTTAGGGKFTISGTPRDVQPSPERIQKNADWLDEFLAQQEGKSC